MKIKLPILLYFIRKFTKGSRQATVTVASSDSSSKSKRMADFVCDGVDDQETILQAINSLPSAGGRVILLEGTYHWGGDLVLDGKNNITIEGMGANTTIINDTPESGDKMFHLINCNNIYFMNFKVDGNYGNHGLAENGFYIETSNNIKFFNLYFENVASQCIYAISGSNFMVRNCYANNSFLLYKSDPDANKSSVIGCHVENMYDGLAFVSGSYNTVVGNIIKDVTEGYPIQLGGPKSVAMANYLENVGWSGIVCCNAPNSAVVGNIVINISVNGIDVDSRSDNTTVFGNSISGCEIGIKTAGPNATIGNNSIRDCTIGIYVSGSSSVVGNTLRDIQEVAIYVDRSGDYSVIRGNIIINAGIEADNTYSAIYLIGDSRDRLRSPFIFDNFIVSYSSNLYKYAIEVGSYVDYPWTAMNKYKKGATGGIYNPGGFDYDNFEVLV